MYRAVGRVAVFALLVLALTHRASAELTDPMRPPDYRSADVAGRHTPKRPHFSLTSTLIAPDRRVAVTNGQRVGTGGRGGGARGVGVGPSVVAVRPVGLPYTVRMLSLGVKRPATGGGD